MFANHPWNHWQDGAPDLEEGWVHLWMLDLAEKMDEPFSLLSADERVRCNRLRSSTDRLRFAHARSCLRDILSVYTGLSPGNICFDYGEKGKPTLSDGNLQFNLSHCGDRALLGLSLNRRIGVDLERVDNRPNLLGIAGRIFGTKTAAALEILNEEQRLQTFFELWTLTEARVKAVGGSVFLPDTDTAAFGELLLQPQSGWIAAVAVEDDSPGWHNVQLLTRHDGFRGGVNTLTPRIKT
jgi:4'-phosphopantetheinyl transferase